MLWGIIGTSHHRDPLVGGFLAPSTTGTRRRAKWQVVLVESVLNLLSQMGHPQNLLSMCFYNLSIYQFSIPNEPLYHLSQLKFDGENGPSITVHISTFLNFLNLTKSIMKSFLVFFYSSPLNILLTNGAIYYHPPPYILSIFSSRSFFFHGKSVIFINRISKLHVV